MGNRGTALRWAALGLALSLPLPLATQHAHACTIIDPNTPAPPSGWSVLQPAMLSEDRKAVPVDTKGFFAIDGRTIDLSTEAAEASLSVEVRDDAGNLVPGHARLFKEYPPPGGLMFGWEAEQPLAVGTQLIASLHGTPVSGVPESVGGDFALVVTGPPVELPTPKASLEWTSYFQGRGESVTCPANPNATSCGGPDHYEVPQSFRELAGTHILWELPQVPVGVAWEAGVEAVGDDADAMLPDPNFATFFFVRDGVDVLPGPLTLGVVVYPTAAEKHCVRVVARDLRTGSESSTEICEAPKAPMWFASDAPQLFGCLLPPSDEATRVWCRLREDTRSSICSQLPPDVPIVSDATTDDDTSRSRTSKGCQIAVGTPTNAGVAVLFAALVVLRRRRR